MTKAYNNSATKTYRRFSAIAEEMIKLLKLISSCWKLWEFIEPLIITLHL